MSHFFFYLSLCALTLLCSCAHETPSEPPCNCPYCQSPLSGMGIGTGANGSGTGDFTDADGTEDGFISQE